jgi:4-amino-4-deoxy-L-arabinose transferase-like glycosyltransferase
VNSGWRSGFARIGAPAPLAALMLLVVALLGASYGYFLQNEYSYNVVCRAGLSANIVQHGHVDIDDYAHLTQDLSVRDGVYYCDKAPGMSFLGAPTALLFTAVLPIEGATAEEGNRWPIFLYLLTLTTSVFWSAFAGVVLFTYLYARTGDVRAAIVGALAYGLATPVFGWATSFFSHAAAGAFLLIGFIALDTAARRIGTGKRVAWPAAAGGLALGTSISVEYTSAIAALIIGAVIGLSHLKRGTFAPLVRMFLIAVGAAVVAIIPTLIYHNAAFGSPFTTGYGFAAVYEETRSGLFGVTWPDPAIIGELIAGTRRGLIWYAPAAVAAIVASVLAWRRAEARPALIVSGLILAAFLFINGGFAYWLGGASTGPRYLTPALAFIGLMLGMIWPALGSLARRAILAVVAVGVFINLASVAVDMTVTEEYASPLTDRVFPLFFQGVLHQTMIYKALKLDGLVTLLPLLLIWAGLGWLILRETRKAEAAPRDAAMTNGA